MDATVYIKFVLALVFVLALIGVATWIVRRFGMFGQMTPQFPGGRRLQIVESRPVGSRHRAVLIRRDETEHLVLLGPSSETVLETGITPPDPAQSESDRAEAATTGAAS